MNYLKLPWTEKYRPKKLDDIVGNSNIIDRLKLMVGTGDIPNMILSGSQGIGKTSSALSFALELYGSLDFILRINGSDSKKVDSMKSMVTNFCQKKIDITGLRMIIVDEVNCISLPAQQILRRLIDRYQNTTVFILICNDSNKIIEPVQSRCNIFRFKNLTYPDILTNVLKIMKKENIYNYTLDGIDTLIFSIHSDMRMLLNNFETIFIGFNEITTESVLSIIDRPHPLSIKKLLIYCIDKDIYSANALLTGLCQKGYSALDIVIIMFQMTKYLEIPEELKLKNIRMIGEAHLRIYDGNDSLVQLSGLLARLSR